MSITIMPCPCCSGKHYAKCCQPYLEGRALPLTPETLMRSRYTAYSMANIAYIQKTMRGHALIGFDAQNSERWAKQVIWIKLAVCQTRLENPNKGHVEFIATMVNEHHQTTLHENSEFIRENGQWYYVSGVQFPTKIGPLISRNTGCPCGSQRKFKSCHGK